MNAAAENVAIEPQGLTREQIRRETAGHLAGDLLERALQGTFYDLQLALMQIIDAELIEPSNILAGLGQKLIQQGDDLEVRLRERFPQCKSGDRVWNLHHRATTLKEEVNLFRQEQFWLGEGEADALAAEKLIKELFNFFSDAEALLLQHDSSDGDSVFRRKRVPEYSSNPYADPVPEGV